MLVPTRQVPFAGDALGGVNGATGHEGVSYPMSGVLPDSCVAEDRTHSMVSRTPRTVGGMTL